MTKNPTVDVFVVLSQHKDSILRCQIKPTISTALHLLQENLIHENIWMTATTKLAKISAFYKEKYLMNC